MSKARVSVALAASIAALTPLSAERVLAQEAQIGTRTNPALSEVIVTARKRHQSIMNVPVVETVLGRQQLQRFQTQNLKDIATLVPGLEIGDSVLSIGTQVSLRGVGTTTYDPGLDQSVSLNIDGIPFSQGLAYSSASFDMAQVEVLKGPQSLFYGKSSPGGVISILTADPTDKPEVILKGGYEFEARERQGQLIVSGPVTDTLKVRLAAVYDDSDGFFFNNAYAEPGTGAVTPSGRLDPSHGFQVRGTAIWTPTDNFSARLKVNDVYDHFTNAGAEKYLLCPDGTGPVQVAPGFSFPDFIGGANTCGPGRTLSLVDLSPAAYGGLPNGGVPYLENAQTYGSLEMNYKFVPGLTLTSTTGIYDLHSQSLLNASESTYAGTAIAVTNHFDRRDLTEELRLNSDYAGPLNFTLGYFFQNGKFADLVDVRGNSALPLGLPNELTKGQDVVGIRTNSVFGEGRWKILPDLELSAGVRWTDERRSDDATSFTTGEAVAIPLQVPHIQADNFAPEVTLTYRPTDDWTVFGALKKGYKSGSYDVATPPTPHEDNSFGEEEVQGGEIGVKSRLDDRRLLMDLSFYDYYYRGLQVGGVIDAFGLPVIKTVNAGGAQVYGMDYDIAYRPAILEDLGLNAAAEWDHARFTKLDNAQCYGGQTIAEGCDLAYNPNANSVPGPGGQSFPLGGFTNQNLSGTPLVRAPDLTLNFGFDYSWAIQQNMTLVVANENHFSTRYSTDLDFPYYQPAYIKTDLSLSLLGPGGRWQADLIGKNLSNVITTGNCVNSYARGSAILPFQFTGTTISGPGGHDSIGCFEDRGREVWFNVTLRAF
jgi:iron complex outermembrane receptor protein